MEKVLTVKDEESGSTIQMVISDSPPDAKRLLSNAIQGYINTLREGMDFSPETQLTRENAMAIAKAVLPAKYTTTIRE